MRSARFYDALAQPLGLRRMDETAMAIAYGRDDPRLWIIARGRPPAGGFGHLALEATGRVAVDAAYLAGLGAGGTGDGPPGPRPQYGARYYAAYLFDPDRYRIELVSGGH